jgi:hypothetical protein
MLARRRRSGLVAAVVVLATMTAAAPASAQTIPFDHWKASGTLTIKKLNQGVAFPAGSEFNGSLDVPTRRLTGHVTVPVFKSRLTVFGIPADATLELVETAPVAGTVVLGGTTTIDATSSFVIRIRRLASPWLPLNLVASRCQTASPVTLQLHYSGPPDFANGFAFAGTTTIPRLTGCGLTTPLLTALMSGPGNPFSVRLTPPAA